MTQRETQPSAIFAKIEVRDTGLNLSKLGGLCFGMGTTIQFFHWVGTLPSQRMSWDHTCSNGYPTWDHSCLDSLHDTVPQLLRWIPYLRPYLFKWIPYLRPYLFKWIPYLRPYLFKWITFLKPYGGQYGMQLNEYCKHQNHSSNSFATLFSLLDSIFETELPNVTPYGKLAALGIGQF